MTPTREPVRSRLFECVVRHARHAPRPHVFSYRLYYLALDLDELPRLGRELRWLRINRRGLAAWREADHFPVDEPVHHGDAGPPDGPGGRLKERVLAWCARRGFDAGPGARVLLVTLPRILGYQFNPVSFYFCSRADGRPVAAVAEVTNTFREVKAYLIPPQVRPDRPVAFARRTPKEFYVSPFTSLDVAFDFHLRAPDVRLAIRIDDYDHGCRILHSTLRGEARPLTDRHLVRMLLRYPAVPLRVMTLIHWHALRLWLKRVPFFRKAEHPERQRNLHRPH
ncbi:MAG TPA: DUF1365 domain-containing protein, partial [Opitutaceae bacterium]|nr:DUF1365 domain-containing protein [Opitutaceae bacterium]